MLGLVSYGSDDSDIEETTTKDVPAAKHVPAPKAKKPVRIVVDAPKRARERDADDDDDDDDRPAKKKAKLRSGAGVSSLLSMLPAPKAAAVAPREPERVLGGAGSGSGLQGSRSVTVEEVENEGDQDAATLLVPTSVKKAAASKPKEPARDFFSLGESNSSRLPILPAPSTSTRSAVQISSAPEIKEYEPPEPTPSDPYPGYYQMQNGQWGAYDPAYYKTFWDKWQRAAMPPQEAKGFEGVDSNDIQTVSAVDEMARARKDIEAAKSLTRNIKTGPSAPNMNIAKAPARGLANQRHQLSTLLYAAYQNREQLEEQIAEGRRNRKEAGNKYGF